LTEHFHIEVQPTERGNKSGIGCTVIECDEIIGFEKWDRLRSVG